MPTKSEKNDVLALLRRDHQMILQIFEDFKKLAGDQTDEDREEGKQELVLRACNELSIHSQVEEELFYPAVRETMGDTSLVDMALVEHQSADMLIGDLEAMEVDDEMKDAKFNVLGEYVRHHIEEEQEKIFPLARKAGIDLAALGEDIIARKDELRREFGLDEGEGHPAARSGNGRKGGARSART